MLKGEHMYLFLQYNMFRTLRIMSFMSYSQASYVVNGGIFLCPRYVPGIHVISVRNLARKVVKYPKSIRVARNGNNFLSFL